MSNESPDETVVRLAENLDISSVSELKAELTSALDLGSPVVLDPSAVERADTASLQLLLAFLREATRSSVAVRVLRGSEAFHEAAQTLGLEASLATESPNDR